MERRLPVGHRRIDKRKLEELLATTGKAKRALLAYLGERGLLKQRGGVSDPDGPLTEGYQKFGVRNNWSPDAQRATVEWFEGACRVEDLFDDHGHANPAEPLVVSKEPAAPLTPAHGHERSPPPHIVSLREIGRIYGRMREGDFVYVFSTDGFLEAAPEYRELFHMVSEALKRGAAIYYFFPDVGPPSKSMDDFEVIDNALHGELGSKSRVHGYFLMPERSFLCARSSRFVVFGKKDPTQGRVASQVFVYVHARGDHWIELRREEYAAFLLDLEDSVDPIPYYTLTKWHHAWRLPNLVADRYRGAFGAAARGRNYDAIRQLVETKDSAERMAREAVRHLRHVGFRQDSAILRWLDIGCENGSNTRVIFDYLKGEGYQVALTAIDTSEHEEEETDEVLRYSPFFRGAAWTFEEACKRAPRARKFDLITSLHSWYVISPIYLVEAYRRLSNLGILLVTLGPWGEKEGYPAPTDGGGNFINQITGAADELVARRFRRRQGDDEYADKVISDDPYRNYAEDIRVAFDVFFGTVDRDFHCKPCPRWVDADLVLAPDGLSELGRSVAEFFLHGVRNVSVDDLAERARDRLSRHVCTVDGKPKLPAFEWDFSVTKDQIFRHRRSELRVVPIPAE